MRCKYEVLWCGNAGLCEIYKIEMYAALQGVRTLN
jgi:hypothetical protein